MKTLLAISACLALVGGTAQAQVGQFQTAYQDPDVTLEARYTLTLGAAPESRLSMSLTQDRWDAQSYKLTLFGYDRHGLAPLGIRQADRQRLAFNEGEAGGGNTGLIVIGVGLALVGGAVILANEIEDDAEDIIDCAFDSGCTEPG